jgi:predicted RNase H-like nuclease (RuvC/YqgF family)
MKHIIVGIDTGKTSAIACLGLDGGIVSLRVKPYADFRWYIDSIRAAGSPAVIASDKKRNNDTIAKLAAIFDAALYTPREDISVMKKKEFAKAWKVANLHERDALSAAIFAYNSYAGKLNQAERIAKGKSAEEIDRIKAMVIKKHSVNEAMEKRKAGRFER